MSASDWSAGILACYVAASAASSVDGQVIVGNLECRQHQKRTGARTSRMLDHDYDSRCLAFDAAAAVA